MTSFRSLGERTIYEGHVITVAVGRFRGPDDSEFERDIVRHPGAVAVVPLEDEEVVLVRQYRSAVDRHMLEIPAGIRDLAGESPSDTARRELLEEVGLSAGSLVKLSSIHNSVGFCDEEIHIYLATDLRAVGRPATDSPEEHEMEIVRIRLADAPALIESGEITDAKTVIGLLGALRIS